jgi:hypothetical protein
LSAGSKRLSRAACAYFDITEIDDIPFEIAPLHLRLELREGDARHCLDLDAGLSGERLKEGLPLGRLPYAAIGVDEHGICLGLRAADEWCAEDRSGDRYEGPAGKTVAHGMASILSCEGLPGA